MTSISVLYSETVDAFRRLLFALSAADCRTVSLGQVQVSDLQDQLGRLQVWGDQSRANLPERARGSLDDLLRSNEALQTVTKGILSQVQEGVKLGAVIAERKYDPAKGSDQDSVSSVSDDSSDESDIDDDDPPQGRRIPKIRFLVSQIVAQIQSLYRLAATVRRPAVVRRYLRSTGQNGRGEVLSAFHEYDYNHVWEKVCQWNCLTKADAATPTGEETAVPVGSPPSSRHGKIFDEEQHALFRRLAEANTKRRQQLLHWSEHPDSSNTESPLSKVANLPPSNKQAVDGGEESQSRVSTIRPDTSVAQNSHRSLRSFSTVAKSAMDDKTESGRPRTVYAESAVSGSISSVRVPNVPKAAETEDKFDCPFCGQALDSANMQARQQWKRHVFRDLRPYICTFAACQTAEKLYATRHEWVYHEMQMHRRKWVCEASCGLEFPSRSPMAKHILHSHQESLTDTQLHIMLDMRERPMDDPEPACCPLCPAEPMSLRQLHTHISQHLEELSLFAIHSAQQSSDEDDISLASNLAARAGAPLDAAAQSSSQHLSSSIPSQASPEDYTAAINVPEKTRDQSVNNFKALSGASQPDSFTKATQWISEASRFPPAVVKSRSPLFNTAEHVTPVRDLSVDEEDAVLAFEGHADYCSQCRYPQQVLEESDTRTLCDLGHEYASHVAAYLYSENGKAFSVIDRDHNIPTLVKIPRSCLATHGLLLAVEDGLHIRATSNRSSNPANELQPPGMRQRRAVVYPSPRSSEATGSLYDIDAAERVTRVREASQVYKRKE